MKEHKGFIQWVKEHKKELLIAGGSMGILALIIWWAKHQDETKVLWNTLILRFSEEKGSEAVSQDTMEHPSELIQSVNKDINDTSLQSDSVPFEVSLHIRNLPEGWHASQEKIEKALENNIILQDGQTWVDSYKKGQIAA